MKVFQASHFGKWAAWRQALARPSQIRGLIYLLSWYSFHFVFWRCDVGREFVFLRINLVHGSMKSVWPERQTDVTQLQCNSQAAVKMLFTLHITGMP